MTMAELSQWIWYASLAVSALLAWRIFRTRLPYRALAIYAIAGLIRGPVLLMFPVRSLGYARAWILTEPIIMALEVWIVLEILRLLKGSYPGIGKYGSRAVALCCLAALTASAASVLVDLHVIEWGRMIAQALFLLKRSTATILALTLLTVQWFIARLGDRGLTANLRWHARITAAYLSILAVGYFLADTGRFSLAIVSPLTYAGVLACHVLWLVMLTPAGEARPVLATTGEDIESAFAALEQQVQVAADYVTAVASK
jgi:hypothetical protein